MRCKPGDLAIIIRRTLRGPQLLGAIVKVLHAAPVHDFALPDGFMQMGVPHGYWVIELQREITTEILIGRTIGHRVTRYGVAPDSALRPLRDNPGDDESLTWAGLPAREVA